MEEFREQAEGDQAFILRLNEKINKWEEISSALEKDVDDQKEVVAKLEAEKRIWEENQKLMETDINLQRERSKLLEDKLYTEKQSIGIQTSLFNE